MRLNSKFGRSFKEKQRKVAILPNLPDVVWSMIFSFLTVDEHFESLPTVCYQFKKLQLVSESWPSIIDFRDISYRQFYVDRALRKLVSIKDRELKLWIENETTLQFLKRLQRPDNLHLLFATNANFDIEDLQRLPISSLTLEQRKITKSDMLCLTSLPLLTLSVAYSDIEMNSLSYLSETKLVSLDLSFTNVTAQDVEHLTELKDLKCLNLWGCRHFDDSALIALPLTLTELKLGNTKVGDSGATHLIRLKNLFFLDLSHTKVTSISLQQLSDLPLKTLIIEGLISYDTEILKLYKTGVIQGFRPVFKHRVSSNYYECLDAW